MLWIALLTMVCATIAQHLGMAEKIAQIGSQLSAASMSTVNFSAGVSSSQGNSTSCSTDFNYEVPST